MSKISKEELQKTIKKPFVNVDKIKGVMIKIILDSGFKPDEQ
ncbi:TPA: hypothetical protein ACRZSB_001718 [Campylobacter jejuni]|nr:hypothetical protein QR412_05950 [Campylobacter jejuni]MCW1356237.1 hypothetical protein [Campylobacter jejuni]